MDSDLFKRTPAKIVFISKQFSATIN